MSVANAKQTIVKRRIGTQESISLARGVSE